MSDDSEDQDLRDVVAEEKSRGVKRRKVDTKERQLARDLLRGLRDALSARTEKEFLEALKPLGLVDDPRKREEALKIWRSVSR